MATPWTSAGKCPPSALPAARRWKGPFPKLGKPRQGRSLRRPLRVPFPRPIPHPPPSEENRASLPSVRTRKGMTPIHQIHAHSGAFMEPLTDVRQISRIAYGFMASQALFTALEFGLFTSLSGASKTLEALVGDTAIAGNISDAGIFTALA